MADVRVDKLTLFEDLGYRPHPGQAKVHDSEAQTRLLACGVRWGKSTCAAMEAVAALLQPCEESRGWIVAPTLDLARRSFRIVQHLLQTQLDHRILKAGKDGSLRVCNLGGGVSEVTAKSADQPVSLLGEALDWVILDEAARLKAHVWEGHLSQRLVDRYGWALLLSTPRGKSWFYELFLRGQSGVEGIESWTSPSLENPHLNPEVIQRERKRIPKEVFRQEYLAQFIGVDRLRCRVCGDPSEEAVGMLLIEEGEEIPECPACGGPVDARGRTLRTRFANGQQDFTLITLAPRPSRPAA